jgi:hypothetical protein
MCIMSWVLVQIIYRAELAFCIQQYNDYIMIFSASCLSFFFFDKVTYNYILFYTTAVILPTLSLAGDGSRKMEINKLQSSNGVTLKYIESGDDKILFRLICFLRTSSIDFCKYYNLRSVNWDVI